MEREESTQHTKSHKRQREPDVLLSQLNGMSTVGVVGNVNDIHGLTAGTIEDTKDTAHQEG